MFAVDAAHQRRLNVSVLGHRFGRLGDDAGVPDASLHRLRHSVATFLVSEGEILQAQALLGHHDAATTLREYSHALPLTDTDIADTIDRQLDQRAAHDDASPRQSSAPAPVESPNYVTPG